MTEPVQNYPPGTQENYSNFPSRNLMMEKVKESEFPEGRGGGKGLEILRISEEPGVPPKPVKVYIEIEQFSNQKYEWNKETEALELDRVLPYPYFYPFAYGFIENTLAQDGDELDALIITNEPVQKDAFYMVYIVGVLIMEDEKGMDEKILCVLEKDYEHIKEVTDLHETDRMNIHWFFTNYKKSTPGKWSKVHSFENKSQAIQIYNKTKLTQ